MIILSTTFSVFAADESNIKPEVILTPSVTNTKVGDTFTITIEAKSDNTIESFDAILIYDKTKLEFINQEEVITSTGDMSGINEATGEFVLTKLASSTTKGELKVATLSFKVLDNVEVGEEILINLLNVQVPCTDIDSEDTNIGDIKVAIKAVGETTPEPEPEPQPQPDPENDPTVAQKDINDAGLSNNAFIIVLGVIVAVVLYAKCKEYRDIK